MILSTKILNFNARFADLVEYFTDNRVRFGYTSGQMEMLNQLFEEWKKAYKKYIHPLSFSDLNTQVINDCYEKCYPLITSMKGRAVSPLIKLNSNDKAYLDVNTNTKTIGRTPVTAYAPNLVCVENSLLLCKFFAMDPKHLGTKRKPAGAGK